MSWIKVIELSEAEGSLRDAYQEVTSTRGQVDNILNS